MQYVNIATTLFYQLCLCWQTFDITRYLIMHFCAVTAAVIAIFQLYLLFLCNDWYLSGQLWR